MMPEQPIEMAVSKSSSSFTIQQKVSIPRFLRCGMKSLLMRLKKLNMAKMTTHRHFLQPDPTVLQPTLFISAVTSGISSTPCLRPTNGSSPVMVRKKTLRIQVVEQKLTVSGFTSRMRQFRALSMAPQTVVCSRLNFRTRRSNSVMATSVGVFRSMFMGISGNCSKSSSRRGSLLRCVFMTPLPPKGSYSQTMLGSQLALSSVMCLSTPHVRFRLVS